MFQITFPQSYVNYDCLCDEVIATHYKLSAGVGGLLATPTHATIAEPSKLATDIEEG